jgi:cytochrome P450
MPRFLLAVADTRGGEHNDNLNTVPYGPLWHALRRNITAKTLHPSRLDHLAPLQRAAILDLVATLSSATSPVVVVEVRDHLYAAVFARLCFGDVGRGDMAPAMCRVVRGFQVAMGGVEDELLGSTTLGRLLQWRRMRRLFALQGPFSELVLPLIAARRESGQHEDDGERRPYIDSLVDLRVQDDGKGNGGRRCLRDEEIMGLVVEFLGAATGTMATCLEWTLAHLVARPEIQTRLRREVDGASKTDRNQLRSMP